jgi:hypothetical protein
VNRRLPPDHEQPPRLGGHPGVHHLLRRPPQWTHLPVPQRPPRLQGVFREDSRRNVVLHVPGAAVSNEDQMHRCRTGARFTNEIRSSTPDMRFVSLDGAGN